MLAENLQIYRDTYELAKALMANESHVPKQIRYGEYGRAVSMSLDALDAIYVANSDVDGRIAVLTRMLQMIGGVRSRVRLLGELGYLPPKKQVHFSLMLEKISKQATGWRNASQCQSRGVKATRACST